MSKQDKQKAKEKARDEARMIELQRRVFVEQDGKWVRKSA
jgi:hypothetical protein